MALQFDLNEIAFEHQEYSFLKIGGEAKNDELDVYDFKNAKYKKIEKIWGTFGWANDKQLAATGKIKFSEFGNFDHHGITKETVDLLRDQNIEIHDCSDIKERFIDLSEIDFLNVPEIITSEKEIQLRFDLFIDKNEGALVYLEENPVGEFHSNKAEMYLITPESTDINFSQERYSLSYKFTYFFNKNLKEKVISFILKIKTRKNKLNLQLRY